MVFFFFFFFFYRIDFVILTEKKNMNVTNQTPVPLSPETDNKTNLTPVTLTPLFCFCAVWFCSQRRMLIIRELSVWERQ
jgi:hypothetical protein